MQAITTPVQSVGDIERAFGAAARELGGGLVVMPDTFVLAHRELVIGLAARHRLPVVYPFTFWVPAGGLVAYGSDSPDLFRRAAAYVDRILKGAKPADLPVQAPVKFELSINLKTPSDRPQCANAARPRRRGHRITNSVCCGARRSGPSRRSVPRTTIGRYRGRSGHG